MLFLELIRKKELVRCRPRFTRQLIGRAAGPRKDARPAVTTECLALSPWVYKA
jgi:hypothetical protein